jgi:predicted adenine nucleotide alpha hydrolase (AANH) superfamily ATPase
LRELGHEVALFFSNSNIDSAEEFGRRLDAAGALARADGVELAVDGYDHESWRKNVAAGHENDREKGERCRKCFAYNLARAAEYARAHGYDAFTTSLSVSPHKVSEMIFAASDDGMFLKEDFKKRGGFQVSVRRAKELGLYRQGYCGCEFSKLSWGQAPK